MAAKSKTTNQPNATVHIVLKYFVGLRLCLSTVPDNLNFEDRRFICNLPVINTCVGVSEVYNSLKVSVKKPETKIKIQ